MQKLFKPIWDFVFVYVHRTMCMCSLYCIVVDWVGQDARSGLFVGVNRTDRGQWQQLQEAGSLAVVQPRVKEKLFVSISTFDSVCIWALVKIIFKEVHHCTEAFGLR